MASRKGQGNKKGKQPAKKRVVPQVSPSQSSSEEDSWPIWQELQQKMAVLEAQNQARQSAQNAEPPRRSSRESKGVKKARLKAVANELMNRLVALEASQIAGNMEPIEMEESAGRRGTDGGKKLRVAMPTETTAAGAYTEESEDLGVPGCGTFQTGEDGAVASTSSGELPYAPSAQPTPLQWPWPSNSSLGICATTPHTSVNMGSHTMPWPYAGAHVGNWGMAYLAAPSQGQTEGLSNTGGWPCTAVPNTGYNTVPIGALPHGDYTMPLGDHLTTATKEKIWKGEFVDIFSLLNRETDKKEIDKEDEREKEKQRRKKPERNWANWLSGYLIYMGVLIKAQPWRALPLVQYLDLIYRAYNDFAGQAWLLYDQAFRMRSAIQPSLRWDEPQPGLWLQFMTPARPHLGERFDCGHLNRRATTAAIPRLGAGQVVQQRLYCFQYNSKGSCVKKPCRFRHECINCGGQHPSLHCFKANAQRQDRSSGPPRKPNAGGNNAGKGPQPN